MVLVILACIFVAVANAGIACVIFGPYWTERTEPWFSIAFLGHLVCALLWAPIVLSRSKGPLDFDPLDTTPPQSPRRTKFPMGHFICLRIVLVVAWITAVHTAFYIWDATTVEDVFVRGLCAVWVTVASFDAFVWDVLYAMALLTPRESDVRF